MIALARFVAGPSVPCRRADYNWGLGRQVLAPLSTLPATSPMAEDNAANRQQTMPRTFEDLAVFSAPVVFVLLWASGFIGAKFGLAYAEPMTFLSLRMIAVVLLLAVVIVLTRPKWPDRAGLSTAP
jgi:hypothetical protein